MLISEYTGDKSLVGSVRWELERVTIPFAAALILGALSSAVGICAICTAHALPEMPSSSSQRLISAPGVAGIVIAVVGALAKLEGRRSSHFILNFSWMLLAASNIAEAIFIPGAWKLVPVPFAAASMLHLCGILRNHMLIKRLRRRISQSRLVICDDRVYGIAFDDILEHDGEEFSIPIASVDSTRFSSYSVRDGKYHSLAISSGGREYKLVIDDAVSAHFEIMRAVNRDINRAVDASREKCLAARR